MPRDVVFADTRTRGQRCPKSASPWGGGQAGQEEAPRAHAELSASSGGHHCRCLSISGPERVGIWDEDINAQTPGPVGG